MNSKALTYQCIGCGETIEIQRSSKYYRKYIIHKKCGAWASYIEKEKFIKSTFFSKVPPK